MRHLRTAAERHSVYSFCSIFVPFLIRRERESRRSDSDDRSPAPTLPRGQPPPAVTHVAALDPLVRSGRQIAFVYPPSARPQANNGRKAWQLSEKSWPPTRGGDEVRRRPRPAARLETGRKQRRSLGRGGQARLGVPRPAGERAGQVSKRVSRQQHASRSRVARSSAGRRLLPFTRVFIALRRVCGAADCSSVGHATYVRECPALRSLLLPPCFPGFGTRRAEASNGPAGLF